MVYGEAPTQTGHVPEKFVVIREEAKLAVSAVGECIGMLARGKKRVGVAQVNALAVGAVFDAKVFVSVVAHGGEHFEADDIFVAEAIEVCGREIPVNAVAHLGAGAVYGDGFGDQERSVFLESDVAVKVEDAFGWRASGESRERACE